MKPSIVLAVLCCLVCSLGPACSRSGDAASAGDVPHKHEHHPPHGGTPVVLGDEVYHIELVRDASSGTLQAYILDGEMDNFIRSKMTSFRITAKVGGKDQYVDMRAVADAATGETVGDSALFQGTEEWIKGAADFDGVIDSVTIRGSVFSQVKFNFPRGNDND